MNKDGRSWEEWIAAQDYIKYLQEVILAASNLEEKDALSYIDREANLIREFRDENSG